MKKKYTIIDLFYRKTHDTKSYICHVCGKKHKQFNDRVLKKHGLSKHDYIDKYGFPNSYYERDSILQSLIEQMFKLYISNRNKWLVLSGYNHQYYTKETRVIYAAKQNCGFREIPILTDKQIKDHLKGKDTIGVFPDDHSSKFLIFDIDSYEGIHVARGVATSIVEFLQKFFRETDIHIVYSGKKGYHITLFFDKPIEISDLHKLFLITLNIINLDMFDSFGVEMRPTLKGPDGLGVKLPLGVNFRSTDNYNNYAYFVDHNFHKIENQIDYFLSIVKSKVSIVKHIVDSYDSPDYEYIGETFSKSDDSVDNSIQTKTNTTFKTSPYNDFGNIKQILENGLTTTGTRHYWSLIIAMYLKQTGYSKEDTYNQLMDWSLKQIERGYSKSTIKEIEQDLNTMIHNGVFSSKKNYSLPLVFDTYSTINLYLTDFRRLETINLRAVTSGKSHISTQKVYFAILVHSQIYDTRYKEFHMRYKDIMFLSGLNSKKTIKKCIDQLSSMNFIKILKRDLKYNPKVGCKEANLYLIIHDSNDSNIMFSFPSRLILEDDLFFKTIIQNYSDSNLKKIFTSSIIRRLRKIT